MLGDFYFSNSASTARPAQATVSNPAVRNSHQAEVLFWESIKNETEPAFFISYLEQYPQGIYAGLAKLKAKSYKPKGRFNQVHLTVKTSPKGARVRILNIVPKYHDGIKLKSGRYRIEVSQLGYQRYLKWISLAREDIVHHVTLIDKGGEVNRVAENPVQISQPNSIAKGGYTGMEFVTINPGCFQMGGDNGDYDEKPVHRVCITQSYELGKYEVTQAQWQKVIGYNPSRFKGDHNPVEQVSWNDVQDFIRKLNQQTGGNYRLPTEVEWEYACRSGGQEQKYCGSDSINGIAWYDGNSGNTVHPVGQKQANALGLYDMSGNVWEWVQDWYDSDYYDSSPTNNPTGAIGGSSRVSRGGSWRYKASYSRSTRRFDDSPDFSLNVLGFRLVRMR
ncbi:MAG: SUMF1/EgtB/PvdO family nonheme iron enzyme [Methyloprofundus sp.]|nr:SUMF1/EgtB/PvdO family nonheme iron enzyme [Methyloprofundus sp.]